MSDPIIEPDEERAASPDSQCRICLGAIKSKSFADSCSHYFCFTCLVRWSKVKAECPLCKRSFKYIFHNIRSTVDYDKYVVEPRPVPQPSASHLLEPAIVLSDIMSYSVMFQVFRSPENARGYFMEEGMRLTDHYITPSSRPVRMHASNSLGGRPAALWNPRARVPHFRALVYRQGRYVNRLTEVGGSQRQCNPFYYRENPSQLGRLRPWIKRELSVFVSPERSSNMTEELLDMLKRIHIDSSELREWLRPKLGDRVTHFLHELKTFATSFYDMAGFDENAQYDLPASPIRSLISSARSRSRWPSIRVPVVELVDLERPPVEPIVIQSDSESDVEVIPAPRNEVLQVTLSSEDEIDAVTPNQMQNNNVLDLLEGSPSPQFEETDTDDTYNPAPSTSRSLQSTASSSSRKRKRSICTSTTSESDYAPRHRKAKIVHKRKKCKKEKKKSKRKVRPDYDTCSSESEVEVKKRSHKSKSSRKGASEKQKSKSKRTRRVLSSSQSDSD